MPRGLLRLAGPGHGLMLGGGIDLYQQIINIVGRSSIIELWVPQSATVIQGMVNGYSGTFTNATLTAGAIRRKPAWTMTGTAYGNVLSDGAKNAFSGAEGTLLTCAKVSAAGDWTDAAYHVLARIIVDAGNCVTLVKRDTNGDLYASHIAGGVTRTADVLNVSITDWFTFGMTWSVTADTSQPWMNGAKSNPYHTLGAWVGIPATMAIASNSGVAASVAWKGQILYTLLCNRPLTESEMFRLDALTSIGYKKVGIIGDSISVANTNGWQSMFAGAYNSGKMRLNNRAVGGSTIIHNPGFDMDEQVALMANDNNDIIIIALGTNDGDNAAITATYQTQVGILKASNPGARIYGMGILNKNDETNRAANNARISTACTNAGITYWNTDGWIVPAADTSDGIHPNDAGSAKIKNAVLARL